MKLCYPVARILVSIAEAEAEQVGVPMSIAVADEQGNLLCFGRMDHALPASAEIAIAKAHSAAALRLPTHEIGKLAQPGGELYGIQHTCQGRIVLFGGGLPLDIRGQVVGGIGISGGTVEQDLQVAQPVVKAFGEMQSWAAKLASQFSVTPQLNAAIRNSGSKLPGVFAQLDGIDYRTAAILSGAVLLLANRPCAVEKRDDRFDVMD